jgi:hypothetical protein
MRKRLVFAAVCILAVPSLFSSSQNDKLMGPLPFVTVAMAGHTTAGGWCECSAPGCICDPGEDPRGQSASNMSDRNGRSLNQGTTSGTVRFDFGSSALMLALAFFLWTRLRS